MFWPLIYRRIWQNKLRSLLTVGGVAVAILAFLLLRSIVDAWYRGADNAADNRLIVRNAVSMIVPLPLSYLANLRSIPGVTGVSYSIWFGGVYIDQRNFFPNLAVGPAFFTLHPEFVIPARQLARYRNERRAAVVGAELMEKYGWKLGDQIGLRSGIYAGEWNFVIRAVYQAGREGTNQGIMFFHYEYLNEQIKRMWPNRADRVGTYLLQIADPAQAAAIAQAVDRQYQNSPAETITETEQAFRLNFVAMTKALLTVIQLVSMVVVLVILSLLANTMAMNVRDRISEYVTLKTLGFGPVYLACLVLGESLLLALLGGLLGAVLALPGGRLFAQAVPRMPAVKVTPETLALGLAAAALVGVLAAVWPMFKAITQPIAAGLRRVG